MNRGVAKRPIFEDRNDMRFFLARLVRQIRLGRIEVHAYCLMTTHFHLLVRSPKGELSEAMRRVQNEHSRWFNRRRRRDGALVRGRYFSKPVLSLSYRRTLVRYIDGNPVKAGIVKSAADYQFGSANIYMGRSAKIWLSTEWVSAESCIQSASEDFTSRAYARAFGPRRGIQADELVNARIACSADEDQLDDLIGAAPGQVRSWLRRKAELADGREKRQPVSGRRALERSLEAHLEGGRPWEVVDGTRARQAEELARIGLLRDLCGLSWRELAATSNYPITKARRIVDHHRRLLRENDDYARAVALIAKRAIERSV